MVACDGIWDVVDDQELVECIKNHLAKGNERHTTARALIEFAKSEGSGDNMTAIVVFLNAPPSLPPAEAAAVNNEGDTPLNK